jgi:hypothetical protein
MVIIHHLILVKETKFQKLALLSSSGKSMKPTLLDPLDGPNLYPQSRRMMENVQYT